MFERLISIGLVPLTIAPFAAGSVSPTMDAILCATILIHSHIGFQYATALKIPVFFANCHVDLWSLIIFRLGKSQPLEKSQNGF